MYWSNIRTHQEMDLTTISLQLVIRQEAALGVVLQNPLHISDLCSTISWWNLLETNGFNLMTVDALSHWEYIVGYLPDIWKFGLFPTFNAAKIVLISYLDNIFGLQSHTKSLQSKKSIFTLMGSHIDNSENSIFMSFNDKKIIYEAFWMFKTLYLMVPWSFVTLGVRKNYSNIDFSICTMIVPVWRNIHAFKSVWPLRTFNLLK